MDDSTRKLNRRESVSDSFTRRKLLLRRYSRYDNPQSCIIFLKDLLIKLNIYYTE